MKKLDHYIERLESIITGKSNLEPLYSFKDFPVFMGCVDTPEEEDIVANMDWLICPESGLIQLKNLIPEEVLYLNQHNDGTGQIWQNLYREFGRFIKEHTPGKSILEIGGAHDWVAKNYWEFGGEASWLIVEPNPEYIKNPKIKVIRAWFDEHFKTQDHIDTVVHSHVLEHTYNPQLFLKQIHDFLKIGDFHLFAFPNMFPMLEKKFTNCLNFEHTLFLTEYFTDYLLKITGFEIVAKEYYGDPHSIFYATKKINPPENPPFLENQYRLYKKTFLDFVSYHTDIVEELNKKISLAQELVYLFGAHIFSQYLIQFGLSKEKIVSVLDNSSIKQGKRLYGTNLVVESPKTLRGKGKVIVILKAGIYNEEIKKDILENINPEVAFW